MPQKDLELKEAIASILGTSRLGRKKVIVKVRKKYPGYGSSQITSLSEVWLLALQKDEKETLRQSCQSYFCSSGAQ